MDDSRFVIVVFIRGGWLHSLLAITSSNVTFNTFASADRMSALPLRLPISNRIVCNRAPPPTWNVGAIFTKDFVLAVSVQRTS